MYVADDCNCYLDMLDKLNKPVCRTVGSSLIASHGPLNYHQNIASLSLTYRYYFGRSSLELAELVSPSYSRRGSTHYSNRLPIFLSLFLDIIRIFHCTARLLWSSLPAEYFSMI